MRKGQEEGLHPLLISADEELSFEVHKAIEKGLIYFMSRENPGSELVGVLKMTPISCLPIMQTLIRSLQERKLGGGGRDREGWRQPF